MSSEGSHPAAPPPHLDALTGIRGLAAWLVVIYHIRLSLQELVPQAAIDFFAKGYLAVDLFFVLSGFVLWCNYGERLRDGGLQQAGAFMWRRFARVWPLHAFILGVFVLFALLLAFTGRSTTNYPTGELPLHILLIHNWGFTSELTWNDPSWSISTELAAYLVFPFIVAGTRWERLPSAALIAIAVALAGALALLFAAYGETSLGARVARLGIWRCLAEFCLGNIACLLWLRWRDSQHAAGWAALCGFAILTVGLLLRLPETMFVPSLFFTGILALALDRGAAASALSTRIVVYLGEISYSTYLSHFLLFIFFKLAFVDETLQMNWVETGGFLVFVLAVSMLLYHLVERPAQRWLNRHQPLRARRGRIVPAE